MSYLPKDIPSAYKRIRKDNPTLPAKQAFLWAKGVANAPEYDWREGRGSLGVCSARFEQDGFDIVVDVSYDDWQDRRVEETDFDTGIRNPNFDYDYAQGYGYRGYGSTKSVHRFLKLEAYTEGEQPVRENAKYYRKAGMAKNVAWEEARKSLQKEAEDYLADDYTEYVVTATAYKSGVELGHDSIGGMEAGEYDSPEDVGVEAIRENDIVGEAIRQAKDKLAELVATA